MIKKTGTPFEEQETIINYLPSRVSAIANVYTANPHVYERLMKLKAKYPDNVQVEYDNESGASFNVPLSWIKIRPNRTVSAEQRAKSAERLKAYHAEKK